MTEDHPKLSEESGEQGDSLSCGLSMLEIFERGKWSAGSTMPSISEMRSIEETVFSVINDAMDNNRNKKHHSWLWVKCYLQEKMGV